MSATAHSVTVANDETLAQMIEQANRRVIVVAPGLSTHVAERLAAKWRVMGPHAISVTLGVDPEIDRLGFGDIAAVRLLERTAAEMGTTLNTHPGVRIGVVIADDETLIFAPTPLRIETGSRVEGHMPIKPNAIRVGPPPTELQADLGAGPNGLKDQIIGLDKAQRSTIQAVEHDLQARPPQPFDVSRWLRVYTANIEFVELRLIGCMVNRRTIKIPPDLFGLADEPTRRLLESTFKLVDEADAGVWGEELRRIKEFIVERFLVHLPTFGYVLRLEDKAKFELAAKTLGKMLNRARRRKADALQAAIDRRLEALHAALLPSVTKSPPPRWKCGLFKKDPAKCLREELAALAGSARDLLEEARVQVRYKGVTYETLKDPAFMAAVGGAMPDLRQLHTEFDAAPGVRSGLSG